VSSGLSALFTTTRLRDQKRIWCSIAHEIRRTHRTFRPTRTQCRNKWNSLKSGYEKLEKLLNRNPEDFPTSTRLCTMKYSTRNFQMSSGRTPKYICRGQGTKNFFTNSCTHFFQGRNYNNVSQILKKEINFWPTLQKIV
jgi:hypothetical protein